MDEGNRCHNNLHAKRICYARRVSLSIGYFQKLLNKRRTTLDIDYTNVPSNREKSEWLPSNE